MLTWCIISIMWEDWGNLVKWLCFSMVSVKGRMSVNHRPEKANNVLFLCETEILNVPMCRPVPPFSGTLLPWAATYLTCVECKCKSWCISQWRTLSSRKEEMRWNNNRNFSYCLRSAVPMKQLKWCHLAVYTLARNEFGRLLWLWRKI